jgi:anti-sigma regulatory factor (Ser/Thr protein kinase)
MTASYRRCVSLEIPAEQDFLSVARLTLSGLCSFTSLTLDEIADIKVALTEAANLFINGKRDAQIRFLLDLNPAELTMTVSAGPGAKRGDAVASTHLLLGTLIDDYTLHGSEVCLVKSLPSSDGN